MTGYDSCGVPGAADADPVPSETRQTDSVVGCWPGYWWSVRVSVRVRVRVSVRVRVYLAPKLGYGARVHLLG